LVYLGMAASPLERGRPFAAKPIVVSHVSGLRLAYLVRSGVAVLRIR